MRQTAFRRFASDRRGNITMMFAATLPVFLMGAGLALDYSRAANLRTKIYAAADAAALAAVTPAMMDQSIDKAQAAAQAAFNNAIASITDIYGAPVAHISVTNDATISGKRNVVITYTAVTNNMFAGLVGMPQTNVGGQVHATASMAPNINFTVLLDNSPSMALPQDQAGINTMISLESKQGGCALACHMASTNNGDSEGNTCVKTVNGSPVYTAPTLNSAKSGSGNSYCASTQGTQVDNYQMARLAGVPLRIDNLTAGMGALMGDADAQRASLSPQPNYSFTVDTFDSAYAIGFTTLMPKTVNTYASAWATASSGLSIMEMYSNGNMCATSNGDPCGASAGGNDVQTNVDNAMNGVNTQMPTPGNGTNAGGDTPQGVLFIITDGVEDEMLNGSRLIQAFNANGAHNYCNDIKARGIKIAVLYTTYLPLTNNGFYNSYVAPFQPNIGTALQSCATPGLYYQAQVGEDLGAALGNLFKSVTKLGHLSAS